MYVGALGVFGTLDPALDVDITHLLTREEGIVFEHNVIRIPNDHSQLIAV